VVSKSSDRKRPLETGTCDALVKSVMSILGCCCFSSSVPLFLGHWLEGGIEWLVGLDETRSITSGAIFLDVLV
jgi:hypothetical protein